MRHWLPWLVWGTALIVWTIGLLVPDPMPPMGEATLSPEARFSLAKTVHVTAYAVLAALLALLPVRPRWRWALLAGLSLHAAGTEYLQQFVPPRTGSIRDVVMDHIGLALGLAVSWAWWRRGPREPPGAGEA